MTLVHDKNHPKALTFCQGGVMIIGGDGGVSIRTHPSSGQPVLLRHPIQLLYLLEVQKDYQETSCLIKMCSK